MLYPALKEYYARKQDLLNRFKLEYEHEYEQDNFKMQKLLYELQTANFKSVYDCMESKPATNLKVIQSAESTSSYKLLINVVDDYYLESAPYVKKIDVHIQQLTSIFDLSKSMFANSNLSTHEDKVVVSNQVLKNVELANSLYYSLFDTESKLVCKVTEIRKNGVELYLHYPTVNVSVVYNYNLIKPDEYKLFKSESTTPDLDFNPETEYLFYEENTTPIILKGRQVLVHNQCNPTQYSIYLEGKRHYFEVLSSEFENTILGSNVYPTVKLVRVK